MLTAISRNDLNAELIGNKIRVVYGAAATAGFSRDVVAVYNLDTKEYNVEIE